MTRVKHFFFSITFLEKQGVSEILRAQRTHFNEEVMRYLGEHKVFPNSADQGLKR